VYSAT